MCAHEGWLYVGTLDWSVFLTYSTLDKWPGPFRAFVEGIGIDETIRREGGFDLWKTQDGDHWAPVTRTGFDNPYNYGVRSLVSTPYGLAIGTINPFGPEVAKRSESGWEYIHNPRGGLEVWLGKTPPPAPDRPIHPEPVIVASDDDRKRPKRRGARIDPAPYELSHDQLRALEDKIDVGSVLPETLAFTKIFHNFSAEGVEHLPVEGPVIIASNHTATPMFTGLTVVMEDFLLTLDFLQSRLAHPARLLLNLNYYHRPEGRLALRDIEKLGCVPATLGNGVRILELGKAVLIYPEGRASMPAYQLRPFFFGMAKMALITGAPIIPAAFIGPHESRFRIEQRGIPVTLNMQKPYPVKYTLTFLPPIQARDYVQSIENRRQMEDFSEMVRGLIQAELDRQSSTRPLVRMARRLQEKYGDWDGVQIRKGEQT
jgi:1-acyl-sn-glycerol-3-phosphate acyltransferase